MAQSLDVESKEKATIARFKRSFRYDPENGKLYWFYGVEAGGDSGKRYRRVTLDTVLWYTHQVVFAMHHGYIPSEVDHIDRDRFNNRIENLRDGGNGVGQSNRGAYGKSGHKHVYKRPSGKYEVQFDGGSTYLGTFDTIQEAVLVAKAWLANEKRKIPLPK